MFKILNIHCKLGPMDVVQIFLHIYLLVCWVTNPFGIIMIELLTQDSSHDCQAFDVLYETA